MSELVKFSSNEKVKKLSYRGEVEVRDAIFFDTNFNVSSYHMFNEIGTEIGVNLTQEKYRGKIVKRIRHYLKKELDLTLSQETISKIANIIDDYQLPTSDFYIRKQYNPYSKWSGVFGDRDSCLFTYNAGFLFGLEMDYGFGVEFYDRYKKPYARLLGEELDNGIVVFNGYSKEFGKTNTTEYLANIYFEFLLSSDSRLVLRRHYLAEDSHEGVINNSMVFYIGVAPSEIEEYYELQSYHYETIPCDCGGHGINIDNICECSSCGEFLVYGDKRI